MVLDEIAFGEKEMAERRLETMRSVPLLRVTDEVKKLAGKILASALLPATADRDATHIAFASVHENGYTFDMEFPAYRERRNSAAITEASPSCRLHAASNMHTGRTGRDRR